MKKRAAGICAKLSFFCLTAAILAGAVCISYGHAEPLSDELSGDTPMTEATDDTVPTEDAKVAESVTDDTPIAETPPVVLMYHCIAEPPKDAIVDLYVSPEQFDKQLGWLKERHYTSGFARDTGYLDTVVLTFDDGYADFYHNAYPLLKKHGMKGTVFVITDLIGEEGYLNADMIREMAASGYVEVQSHTASHAKLDTVTGEPLWAELAGSKQKLEEITGGKVYAICYPNGAYNCEVTDCARELYGYGFTTIFPSDYAIRGITDLHAVPRYGIGYGLTEEEFFGIFIPKKPTVSEEPTADADAETPAESEEAALDQPTAAEKPIEDPAAGKEPMTEEKTASEEKTTPEAPAAEKESGAEEKPTAAETPTA